MQKAPKQIELSNIKSILSRTDLKGNIKYCNKYFSEISGYTEAELLNTSHNIIRHPDMPKVVFKWMWQRLKNNKNMIALVKNKPKTATTTGSRQVLRQSCTPSIKHPKDTSPCAKQHPNMP